MRPQLFTPPATWATTYQMERLWVRTTSTALALSTTIASGSNSAALPQATINVASTTGFPSAGTIYVVIGGSSVALTYTGTTSTTFTGCTGGTGTLLTGQTVVSALNGAYSWQEQRQALAGNGTWEDNTEGRSGTQTGGTPLFMADGDTGVGSGALCEAVIHYNGYLLGIPPPTSGSGITLESPDGSPIYTSVSVVQIGEAGHTALTSGALGGGIIVPSATPASNGVVNTTDQSIGGVKRFYYSTATSYGGQEAIALQGDSVPLRPGFVVATNVGYGSSTTGPVGVYQPSGGDPMEPFGLSAYAQVGFPLTSGSNNAVGVLYMRGIYNPVNTVDWETGLSGSIAPGGGVALGLDASGVCIYPVSMYTDGGASWTGLLMPVFPSSSPGAIAWPSSGGRDRIPARYANWFDTSPRIQLSGSWGQLFVYIPSMPVVNGSGIVIGHTASPSETIGTGYDLPYFPVLITSDVYSGDQNSNFDGSGIIQNQAGVYSAGGILTSTPIVIGVSSGGGAGPGTPQSLQPRGTTGNQTAAAGTKISTIPTVSVNAGGMLVVMVAHAVTGTDPGFTITFNGLAMTQAGTTQTAVVGSVTMTYSLWYSPLAVSTTGDVVITSTFTGTGANVATASVIYGSVNNTTDQFSGGTGTTGTPDTGATGGTVYAYEIAMAGFAIYNPGSPTGFVQVGVGGMTSGQTVGITIGSDGINLLEGYQLLGATVASFEATYGTAGTAFAGAVQMFQ